MILLLKCNYTKHIDWIVVNKKWSNTLGNYITVKMSLC